MVSIEKQLEQIKRGCVDLVSEEELITKLKRGKPLRIKVGFDPTISDLHLGHTITMQKMRQFQELGHHVIFLVGDYTAQIGDPSGRSETRKQLTHDEVIKYAKTYVEQAHKILDPKKTEIRYNSEWFNKMNFADIARLASHYTVARMMEREDFKTRYQAGHPLSIHEFLYPLMQGYDSVMLKADMELGGTDQVFNLLIGRDLQRSYGQEPQVVLTMPLLVGTDGVQKMSKSYGNFIGIAEKPSEMFGKIMSITDGLMWEYYKLLSLKSLEEIARFKKDVEKEKIHPKEAKVLLAKEIVARFHSEKLAEEAEKEFEKIFSKKEIPTEIETEKIKKNSSGISVVDLIVNIKMAASKTEARRLIGQGGVSLGENKVTDINMKIDCKDTVIIKVGKRKFKKVVFE